METKSTVLYIKEDLLKKIEDHKDKNFISTRNSAIVQLILKGLEKDE